MPVAIWRAPDGAAVGDGVGDGLGDGLDVGDALGNGVGLADVGVGLGVGVGVGVGLGVGDGVGLGLGDGVGVAGDGVGVAGDGEGVVSGSWVGVAGCEARTVSVSEAIMAADRTAAFDLPLGLATAARTWSPSVGGTTVLEKRPFLSVRAEGMSVAEPSQSNWIHVRAGNAWPLTSSGWPTTAWPDTVRIGSEAIRLGTPTLNTELAPSRHSSAITESQSLGVPGRRGCGAGTLAGGELFRTDCGMAL